MKTFVIAVILVLSSVSYAFADDSNASSIEVPKDAPQILRNTKKFIIGRVFEEGRISESEIALRELLKRDDAAEQLRKLIKEESICCQLYALLGLRLIAAGEFEAEYDRYRGSKIAVPTMAGCIAFQATAGDIADDIKQGKIK